MEQNKKKMLSHKKPRCENVKKLDNENLHFKYFWTLFSQAMQTPQKKEPSKQRVEKKLFVESQNVENIQHKKEPV